MNSFLENYLKENPDLVAAGIKTHSAALRHYIRFGIHENRVSSSFDSHIYLHNYPDLSLAGITTPRAALNHYLRFGIREKRVAHRCTNKVFDLKINRVPQKHLNFKVSKVLVKLPESVDLRQRLPPCYDQGSIGSCTANALVAAYQLIKPEFMGSRLFLYYNERVLEKTTAIDAGAYLYDGVKSLINNGVCAETDWPYTKKFNLKPTAICYTRALDHQVLAAKNVVQSLDQMKQCLADGFPFVVGILVYSPFLSTTTSKTGVVTMPLAKDRLLGGHAILIVGYLETTRQWIFRNSWGTKWGANGYGYLPYDYLVSTKLSSDLWTINVVE
uniref:Peptidase C1A papain C-terminal domain-containing protein n=1 Tax=viral metagenome TaxID=1070528 RepID=A0A6C0I8M6_9ZZZZ